jgi:hypothetical protein
MTIHPRYYIVDYISNSNKRPYIGENKKKLIPSIGKRIEYFSALFTILRLGVQPKAKNN